MPGNNNGANDLSALFESIINFSADAIISKKLDGTITSWNKAAENLFGYSCQEMMGKHISVLFPAEIKDQESGILEEIKQGKHIHHYETERLKKDGSRVHISLSVSPIKDANGNITGAAKIARNITERKHFEVKLALSEKIYRTIAANLPGAVVTIVDKSGKFTLAEGEGLKNLGYTKEGLENKPASEVLGPAANALIDVHRQKAFKGEDVLVDVPFKDHYYRVHYLPLRDELGEVYAVMTISLDITEIKNASAEIQRINESLEKKVAERTEQLENLNKELEAFSFSVSHDLRAPLRIITAYTEILEKDYTSVLDHEGKKLVGNIISNTKRMSKLIDELLKLARLGKKEIIKVETDMNELVMDVIDDQTPFTGKGVEFKKDSLLPVCGDPILLKQVWSNLISNAIKYSRDQEHQVVEIRSVKKADKIIYSVKDYGVGFNMHYSHKLFGVFQRLHSQSEFEGSGIGLAVVQRIIVKHGGSVWAEAEENKGATFYFSLPAMDS